MEYNYTPWETLEDTHTALVQGRLHSAGGLEVRHLTVTEGFGWFVALTPLAVERLRLLLGVAPMHDTGQAQVPCETPTPLDMAVSTNGVHAPAVSILDAAAQHFYACHGHYWSPETRQACERELTARGWVHRLGYDEHKVELARDAELAHWFPPLVDVRV